MTDKDDIESKLRSAGDNAKEALDHASGAAIEAARGAVDKAPEIKERLTDAAGRAKERAARRIQDTTDRVKGEANEATSNAVQLYGRAGETAQHGYEAASARIASAPMSSILIAGVVGLIVGWAWRGSVEADRRSGLIDQLPRYLRDRLDL